MGIKEALLSQGLILEITDKWTAVKDLRPQFVKSFGRNRLGKLIGDDFYVTLPEAFLQFERIIEQNSFQVKYIKSTSGSKRMYSGFDTGNLSDAVLTEIVGELRALVESKFILEMDPPEEARFTLFLREKAAQAEREVGYRPKYFLGMLGKDGGYRTAVKLLSEKKVSEGFTKLWEYGLLKLSVEALVVESEWRCFFDPMLLRIAEQRLESVQYSFKRWEKALNGLSSDPDLVQFKSRGQMECNCLVIAWPGGDEYIDFDTEKLGSNLDIFLTRQAYKNGSKIEIYEVTSTIKEVTDGLFQVDIKYDAATNAHIDDSWWGTTRIVLRKEDKAGMVSWLDDNDSSRNFPCVFRMETIAKNDYVRQYEQRDAELETRTDLPETVKQAMRNERRGQRVFRERVLQIEPACRLTEVSDPAHLRASHIKPWAVSDHRERLDGNNGLMLSPHVDHLFDRAYISFEDDGRVIVLNDDIGKLLKQWGIDLQKSSRLVTEFAEQQKVYLAHHRKRLEANR